MVLSNTSCTLHILDNIKSQIQTQYSHTKSSHSPHGSLQSNNISSTNNTL